MTTFWKAIDMKKLNGEEKRKIAAVALRHIKPSDKTQMVSDGYGLFLVVMPAGSKYWRYRFRFAGKQKQLALGVFPDITLSEARKLLATVIPPQNHRGYL